MPRRVASSKKARVETGLDVVNAWQVVVPEASSALKKWVVASAAYSGSVYFCSSENGVRQPIEQLVTIRANHSNLRKMDMPINKPGHDNVRANRSNRYHYTADRCRQLRRNQ